MSVPLCLMAAGAEVMDTKGSLGINSALALSFWALSHAKTPGGWWPGAGGDDDWQLQPHIELPLETGTSDWLTNERSRNGFYLKEKALTRIEGSSPVSFLKWEMGRNEYAWQIELTIQYFDKERLGRTRTMPRGTAARLKLKINEAWSWSASDLQGFASNCSFPSIGKLFRLC